MENSAEQLRALVCKRVAIDVGYFYVRGTLRVTDARDDRDALFYITVRDHRGDYAGVEFAPENVKAIEFPTDSAGFLVVVEAVITLK